jgi:hypothetical protein
MLIKNFGMSAKRADAMLQRIMSDIERRAALPQLDLRYLTSAMSIPVGGNMVPVPSISAFFEDRGFHALILEEDPNAEELTIILTHTRPNNDGVAERGFYTTYKAKPQAAVFVSFDILQFFLERVEHLNVKDAEDEWVPNPVLRKPLEVENLLKAAYPDLPQEYTWKLNLEAKKPDNQPVVEFHATNPQGDSK